MKKSVIILVMIFAFGSIFAQNSAVSSNSLKLDSLQKEFKEFKKLVHYAKLFNFDMVNVDPLNLNLSKTSASKLSIKKLINKLYVSSKTTFVSRIPLDSREEARGVGYLRLLYQSFNDELYLLEIKPGGSILLYKSTKNEFCRLVNRDMALLATFDISRVNNGDPRFDEDSITLYASEVTVKKILQYMLDLNARSISYVID